MEGRKTYLEQLHSALLRSAKSFHMSEYKSNADFSNNFENDILKDSFGRVFKENIENKTGINNAINHRTLINFLNAGFTPNAQKNTLNLFSKYLGYEDFQEFCNKSTYINKSKIKSPLLWVPLGFVLLLGLFKLASLLFLNTKNSKEISSEVEQNLIQLVKDANEEQFKEFKNLPDTTDSNLEQYYNINGSAFKVIKRIINRHAEEKRVINFPKDNPSYFTIHDIQIKSLTDSNALVESQEHWYLMWYNLSKSNFEKKYDITNKQIYVLKKFNNKWKIEANDYIGESKTIP